MKTIIGRLGDVEVEINTHEKPLKDGKPDDLKPEDFVRYDVVVFKKQGKQPVFLAIEREDNKSTEAELKKYLFAQAVIERQPHRYEMNQFIEAKEMEWFEMNKKDILNKVGFVMPTQGKAR